MELTTLVTAVRKQYRFPSPIGDLTMEQLWDLPLTSSSANKADLDKVARLIHTDLKSMEEVSFVTTTPNVKRNELQNKLDIVVFVINTIKSENEAAANRRAKLARREQLLKALESTEQAKLANMTPEQIRAELAALEI